MVSDSSDLGPPDLQEDLDLHFHAVASLFLPDPSVSHSPPSLTPVPTFHHLASSPDGEPVLQESPSVSLPPFWRENQNLHSFLLISFASFAPVFTDAPTFPHASLDSTYSVGLYALRALDLQIHGPSKWKTILKFPSVDIPLIARPPQIVYFRLN